MFVNISRNKFLINKSKDPRNIKNRDNIANCNHCGGAFKKSGDMVSCIMCSRELGHICCSCTHPTVDIVEQKKRSAQHVVRLDLTG